MNQAIGVSPVSCRVPRGLRFISNGRQKFIEFLLEGSHINVCQIPDRFRDDVEQLSTVDAETSFEEGLNFGW